MFNLIFNVMAVPFSDVIRVFSSHGVTVSESGDCLLLSGALSSGERFSGGKSTLSFSSVLLPTDLVAALTCFSADVSSVCFSRLLYDVVSAALSCTDRATFSDAVGVDSRFSHLVQEYDSTIDFSVGLFSEGVSESAGSDEVSCGDDGFDEASCEDDGGTLGSQRVLQSLVDVFKERFDVVLHLLADYETFELELQGVSHLLSVADALFIVDSVSVEVGHLVDYYEYLERLRIVGGSNFPSFAAYRRGDCRNSAWFAEAMARRRIYDAAKKDYEDFVRG